MKIIFFGSSSYVIPILEVLRKNFDLALVITTERLAFRGEALEAPVINYCIKNKISYISVSNLSDPKVNRQLSNVNCQLAVLADFGLIIPEKILNAFPKGIMNVHPSLLPKFRGPSPVQTAILNSIKTTGVSIMKIDKEIDHGPILGQEKAEILTTDTAESLSKRLFAKGANLLPKTLDKYLKDNLMLQAQDHAKATFTKPLNRQDGYVDIAKIKDQKSKIELNREIRAYFPWPGVWFKTKLNGVEKIIKLLPEDKLQVEGKKPIPYKDFLNGYPQIKQQLKRLLEQLA